MHKALIQNDITLEFLSHDELKELTGSHQLRKQIDWLKDGDWHFELNHRNRVLVSRWYLRLKMSGVTFSTVSIDSNGEPDFGAAR